MTSMLTLTTAMLLMARWSYEQGFFDYTNALEQTRLELLSPQLIELYVDSGKNIRAMPKREITNILASFPAHPQGSNLEQFPRRPLPGLPKAPSAAMFDLDNHFIAGACHHKHGQTTLYRSDYHLRLTESHQMVAPVQLHPT
jgi:two-component system sensor histidine kinase BaeS